MRFNQGADDDEDDDRNRSEGRIIIMGAGGTITQGFYCTGLLHSWFRFGTCRGSRALPFAVSTRFEANLIKLAAGQHGCHRDGRC